MSKTSNQYVFYPSTYTSPDSRPTIHAAIPAAPSKRLLFFKKFKLKKKKAE